LILLVVREQKIVFDILNLALESIDKYQRVSLFIVGFFEAIARVNDRSSGNDIIKFARKPSQKNKTKIRLPPL